MNAQQKLKADIEKTSLTWLGEKVLGQHTGTLKLNSGWLHWEENRITGGEFIIDMTSIETDEKIEKLEGHLKSDDFFGVNKFPESVLEIVESTPFENGNGTVKGNLKIKDITHPVEFKAALQKEEEGMRFFTNIVVDRSKYNVRFGSGSFFSNLGDKTIYDEFKLKVNLMVN